MNQPGKTNLIVKALPIFTFLLFCNLYITSCATNPKFSGTGDLCGLVVDENNKPIKDFVIYCYPSITNIKTQTINIKPVITNESGLFVFYGLPSGSYTISGEKPNYLRLSETPYQFSDRGKILCLQTKSFKAAVKTAEELIALGQTKEARSLLNGISTKKLSSEKYLVTAYQLFTVESEREKRSLMNELRAALKKQQIPQSEKVFYKEFLEKLEEVKNE